MATTTVPTRMRSAIVVAEFVFVLLVWQIAVGTLGLVSQAFLPAPLSIAKSGAAMLADGEFWRNLRYSAVNWATGYSFAALFGVVTGLVVGTVTQAHRLVVPLAWSLYATPLVAIRPMTVVWFGFGAAPIIFLIFVSAIFPVMLNTAAGVRTVDDSLLRAARVFGASRLQRYLKIILPATLPHISAGLRLAIPSSLIGMLVGEIVGSPLGLGALISVASSRFQTERVMAVIVVLVTLSVTLVRAGEWLQHRVAPWHASEQRGF